MTLRSRNTSRSRLAWSAQCRSSSTSTRGRRSAARSISSSASSNSRARPRSGSSSASPSSGSSRASPRRPPPGTSSAPYSLIRRRSTGTNGAYAVPLGSAPPSATSPSTPATNSCTSRGFGLVLGHSGYSAGFALVAVLMAATLPLARAGRTGTPQPVAR
ncbi:hypothetical protein ABGB18_34660 [Nonomuraea sp. B12E4]|uniref:hypothetical protein n=1 Tax=Nonomuraea sp. B12E4 TaxID=3153564 RepID=UPI00325CDB1B